MSYVKETTAMNNSVNVLECQEPESKLLKEITFSHEHLLTMVGLSVLMVVSSVGNFTVLATLLRKNKRSRINLMLMHLAISDLSVTFLMMPMEIAWSYTVSWWAGSTACHIMSVFRVFGLYLSSSVLVCITVDRYFAVLKPMSLKGQSAKHMLTAAWVVSIVSSLPQAAVFHLESPKKYPEFIQCVAFNAFPSGEAEVAYNLFTMSMMYGIPLIVIVFCYVSILMEIRRRSKDTSNDTFRRSSLGYLGRAKVRTLRMTIVIVLAYIVCWTPYYIMSIWYWLDLCSALKVNSFIRRSLFLFASANSCMNPIVYGLFNLRKCGMGKDAQSSGTSPPHLHNRPERIAEWKRKMEAIRQQILLELMLGHKVKDYTQSQMRGNVWGARVYTLVQRLNLGTSQTQVPDNELKDNIFSPSVET